jgi:hypothetical protein
VNSLFDFLTALATNPKQQLAFARSPEAVMRAAGLAKAEQTVLKSRDKVTAVYADDLSSPALCIFDPNPDPMPDPDPPPDARF